MMMKRALLCLMLILSVAVLSACGAGKAMEVKYVVRSAANLNKGPIFLRVIDQRANSDLVGPTARAKDLFRELDTGRFDLLVEMPNNSTVTMTNLTPAEAVREAVSRRLQSQGVTISQQQTAGIINVDIYIDQMTLDLLDRDLEASVYLNSVIYRDSTSGVKSNSGFKSGRTKLIGGSGGARVMSDALSQAVNGLNLSGIDRY